MKPSRKYRRQQSNKSRSVAGLLCVCLIYTQLFQGGFELALAQDAPPDTDKKDPTPNAKSAPESADGPASGAPKADKPADAAKDGNAKDAKAKGGKEKSDEIEVSFQGANIDMIVQWLAQQTGK